MKVRHRFDALAHRPELYDVAKAEDEAMVLKVPMQLNSIRRTRRFKHLLERDSFPRASHLAGLEILFGAYMSDYELKGVQPSLHTVVRMSHLAHRAKQSLTGKKFLATAVDQEEAEEGGAEDG